MRGCDSLSWDKALKGRLVFIRTDKNGCIENQISIRVLCLMGHYRIAHNHYSLIKTPDAYFSMYHTFSPLSYNYDKLGDSNLVLWTKEYKTSFWAKYRLCEMVQLLTTWGYKEVGFYSETSAE